MAHIFHAALTFDMQISQNYLQWITHQNGLTSVAPFMIN